MRYIAYCRKSTDEKDKQVLSIDQQIAELREFAQKANIQISEFIIEAKTAKIPGRPKFQEMIEKLERGEADGILSWHPDRLARNSMDGGKIIYLLDTGKLKDLKFVSFWFENSPQGKFVLNIAFGQSKYYVDNLSENVKRGLRHKIRLGIWPVQAPLGYVNDKETRSIKVDIEKSAIVKKSFEIFSQGDVSFTSISKFLFTGGIRKSSNKIISPDRVKKMLSNPFYLGVMNFKGEKHLGKHETFISKELFEEVQKQIERFEKPRSGEKERLPYMGLLRCGGCSGVITGERQHRHYKHTDREITHLYYRCTRKHGKCIEPYITQDNLDQKLRDLVWDVAIPTSWQETWLKLLERDKQKEQMNREENIKQIQLDLQSVERKLNTLLDTYLDGILDENSYKSKKNELFDLRLELEDRLQKLNNGISPLECKEKFIKSAFLAQKIASEKNNHKELALFVRDACSNVFLVNRHLLPTYKKGFDTVFSLGGKTRLATLGNNMSVCVTPLEFESKFSE